MIGFRQLAWTLAASVLAAGLAVGASAPAEAQSRGAGVHPGPRLKAGPGLQARPGFHVKPGFHAGRRGPLHGFRDGWHPGRGVWRGHARRHYAYLWPHGYSGSAAFGPWAQDGWGGTAYGPIDASNHAPSPPVLAGGAVTLVPITSTARTPGRPLLIEIGEADGAPLSGRTGGPRAQLQRSAWRDATSGPRILTARSAGAARPSADTVEDDASTGARIIQVRPQVAPRERR